jgi:hypothetical protein
VEPLSVAKPEKHKLSCYSYASPRTRSVVITSQIRKQDVLDHDQVQAPPPVSAKVLELGFAN